MEYTVHHGLRSHRIQGTLLAQTTTEELWKDRWTEIYLYKVDPGGAPTILHPRTKDETLREGGYLSHVVGPSFRAHTLDVRHRLCKGGVETEICQLQDEAVPCPVCRPSFPYISRDVFEEDMPAELARVRRAREGNTGLVRAEVTRHQIHPAITAEEIIAGLTEGVKTTVPGEDVVRKAALADPDIRAELERLGVMTAKAV